MRMCGEVSQCISTKHCNPPSVLLVIVDGRHYILCAFAEAALNGVKDIIIKHPTELKLHKVAIIEKLQERICDTDKVVRESLYSLLQSQIILSLKEVSVSIY
jgi:hypothetical protein